MNTNIKNILKEKLILKKLEKNEIFIKILKSIKQNNNIENGLKNYTNMYINKKNYASTCKRNKICFYTGKRKGFLGFLGFSRYTIKSLILQNRFCNLKKNNW